MSGHNTEKLAKISNEKLLERFTESIEKRGHAKNVSQANRYARLAGSISKEIMRRGDSAVTQYFAFILDSPPEIQIWAARDLLSVYPKEIKQLLQRLTEYTGEISISAKLILQYYC